MKSEITTNSQQPLYRLGGVAALLVLLTALLEILITFLPGGYTTVETVVDWFTLLQNNWFMGLRNLGLLNIVLTALGIPVLFALYTAHRSTERTFAALAFIISMIGTAVFYATNRAFPMLDLSLRYAAAATEMERAALVAAGQAMLSVGQSHTPGTFLAFFLLESAGVMMSLVMLHSGIFSKATAVAGLLGFGMLLLFEFISSFVLGLGNVTMILAMLGGLSTMVWYVLIARRLFRLAEHE